MLKNEDIIIGKHISYLTIVEKYNITNNVLCQCVCGEKIYYNIENLLNERKTYSCGCILPKNQSGALYVLWRGFSNEEKDTWGTERDFMIWAVQQGYYTSIFIAHKKTKKLPYSKDNLEFGVFINEEFFSIQRLKDNKIVFDRKHCCFVTSYRIKNLILSYNQITKELTRQKDYHKKLSKNLFKLLK